MHRASASLVFIFASSALTIGFAVACSNETRPPISDTPGARSSGSGSGPGGDAGGDGGASTFASFVGFNPTGLAADGDTLYVTLVPLDSAGTARVASIAPSGAVTVLVSDAVAPSSPTISSGTLFYIDTPSGSSGSSILSLNLADISAGPSIVVSALSRPSGLAVGGSSLLVATDLGGTGVGIELVSLTAKSTSPITQIGGEYTPAGIATDGANVYFAARATGGGEIASSPLVAGSADPIWSGSDLGTLGPVVVANANVYFSLTSDPNGTIFSVPANGGNALPIVTGLTQPSALAVNSAFVYYTDNTATGGIFRAPLNPDSGIAAEQIADVADPQFLVLGATAVYATTDQAIVRVTQ